MGLLAIFCGVKVYKKIKEKYSFKNFLSALSELPEEKRGAILESLRIESGLEKKVFRIFMRQSYEHVK